MKGEILKVTKDSKNPKQTDPPVLETNVLEGNYEENHEKKLHEVAFQG